MLERMCHYCRIFVNHVTALIEVVFFGIHHDVEWLRDGGLDADTVFNLESRLVQS